MCIGEVFPETEGQFFFSPYLFWVCNPRSLKIFFSTQVAFHDGIVKKIQTIYIRRNLVNVLDPIQDYSTVWRLNEASCSCVTKPSLPMFNFGLHNY